LQLYYIHCTTYISTLYYIHFNTVLHIVKREWFSIFATLLHTLYYMHFTLYYIHCTTDVSNVSKDWSIHIQWSHAVIAEFFCQGDLEIHLDRTVTRLCIENAFQRTRSRIVRYLASLYREHIDTLQRTHSMIVRYLVSPHCKDHRMYLYTIECVF
jgi:hypothetical protein